MRGVVFLLVATILYAATPVVEWRFDTCAIKKVLDSASNGEDATAYNGVGSSLGKVCQAVVFDGKDDYIQMDKDLPIDLKEFSVSLWFYIENYPDNTTQQYALISKDLSLELYVYKKGALWWWWKDEDGTPHEIKTNEGTVEPGRWYHVVLVYRKNRQELYLDTKRIGREKVKKTPIRIDHNLTLGVDLASSTGEPRDTYLHGMLDEVKIYDVALKKKEIKDIYNQEKTDYAQESQRLCPICYLEAEWRMDECDWSSEDVIDSTSHGYDLKPLDIETESNESWSGMICRIGNFPGYRNQLAKGSFEHRFEKGLAISGWFHIAQKQVSYARVVEFGPDKDRNNFWKYSTAVAFDKDGKVLRGWVSDGAGHRTTEVQYDLEENGLIDNRWHFFTYVFSKDRAYLYIDAKEVNSADVTIDDVAQAQKIALGGYYPDNGSNFSGLLDEIKVFDQPLSPLQIQQIYQNELNRKNWNGSQRSCKVCCRPYDGPISAIEFEGGEITLTNTYDDPIWDHVDFKTRFSTPPVVFAVINKVGENPAAARIKNVTTEGFDIAIVEPQGEDGPHISQKIHYFAINEGVHKIGNVIVEVGKVETKKVQGKYLTSGSDIGWQKLHTKTSICDPAIVANIQTMNNELGDPPKTVSKPWMTTALKVDSSGIYVALDASETDEGYPLNKDETIGYMIARSGSVGSFVDNAGKKILFEIKKTTPLFVGWDDECRSVEFAQNFSSAPLIAGWKMSRYGDNGGWFRLCTLDPQKVGFVVDEDRARDKERHHIAEVGGIFAFSDSFVLDEVPDAKEGVFTAVDRVGKVCSATNDWENNLSTKVVSSPFDLYILAKDKQNDPLEANITKVELYFYGDGGERTCRGAIKSKVVVCDDNDNSLTACPDTSNDGCAKLEGLRVDRAVRCVQVHIQGRDIKAKTQDVNESNSTDDFAIRPDRFELTLPAKAYAEENFTISVYAKDWSGNEAKDYNETLGNSFDIISKDLKAGCKNGKLDISSFSFVDGKKESVQVNYDDIGDINITIHEINGSEFAKVDADDTPLDERLIAPASAIIRVDPYEANVTDVQWSVAGGGNWLYMIKDRKLGDMNVTLTATIELYGKKGTQLEDFNSSCYAKDVEVQALYDVDNTDGREVGLVSKGAVVEDGKISDIDKKMLFLAADFINGEQTRSYAFNIDANYSTPIAPIFVKLKDVLINTQVAKERHGASQTGKIASDQNATFYYARVLPEDLLTTKQTDSTSVKILVYDKGSPYTAGFEQTLLNWYLNTMHTDTQKGGIEHNASKKDVTLSSADADVSRSFVLNSGIYEVDITKEEDQKAYIHLDISSWLWYSSVGKAYSFAPDSSCAEHPCLIYTYRANMLNKVQSGEVSGVHYDLNISTKKKGVKVFR